MFEFYQVKSIRVHFYPYKYEYTSGAVSGLSTQGTPVLSIIDPDNVAPVVSPLREFFGYGNCHITKAYDTHTRSMNNFTDLGLSK